MMAKVLISGIAALVGIAAYAADVAKIEAMRSGAMVREVLRIVDEQNVPVPYAKVWGGLSTGSGLNAYSRIDGVSDSNGMFVVQGVCRYKLRCEISHSGYYPSVLELNYASSRITPAVCDGKWQPYGQERTVVLKKIRTKGGLSVYSSAGDRKIPRFNEWIPFDLEVCDWCCPDGRGRSPDVLLKFEHRQGPGGIWDSTRTMSVSFTNSPYAGAYELKQDRWSMLRSVATASTNAGYRQAFRFSSVIKPNGKDEDLTLKSDSYLVYRTRTKIDSEGRLVSAHYGKIYGEWSSGQKFMRLGDGCFNPKENDLDIEEDVAVRGFLKQFKQ